MTGVRWDPDPGGCATQNHVVGVNDTLEFSWDIGLFVEPLAQDTRRLSRRTFEAGMSHSCVEIPEWLGTRLFIGVQTCQSLIGLSDQRR